MSRAHDLRSIAEQVAQCRDALTCIVDFEPVGHTDSWTDDTSRKLPRTGEEEVIAPRSRSSTPVMGPGAAGASTQPQTPERPPLPCTPQRHSVEASRCDRSPQASPFLGPTPSPSPGRIAAEGSRSTASNLEAEDRSHGGSGMAFELLAGAHQAGPDSGPAPDDPLVQEASRFLRFLHAPPTSPVGRAPRSIPPRQMPPSASLLHRLVQATLEFLVCPLATDWWQSIASDPSIATSTIAVHSTSAGEQDFKTLGVLGTGSYGTVHVARRGRHARLYAVKSMNKKMLKHKSAIHCALRELCCSVAVQSPFVAPVHFAWETQASIKFAMPFCEGGDLERHLLAQPQKCFPEHVVRFYAAEILIGLKHLHKAGIIHRDVKASNILIDASGHLKLCDLGLSVFLHTCSTEAPQEDRPCQRGASSVLSSTGFSKCCLGCLHVNTVRDMQRRGAGGVLDFISSCVAVGEPGQEAAAGATGPTSTLAAAVLPPLQSTEDFSVDMAASQPDPHVLRTKLATSAVSDCRLHMGMACTCNHTHDDGSGWYKGRAGTPAYWCPEMLVRDSYGGRVAYGMSADWWSYGCLLYALLCGRSPFSSGQGPAGDNSLTLHASPVFDPSVFSPQAMDLVGRLLTIGDGDRLGVGPCAWADIQRHAFFKDVDWDLVEARTMPAPLLPAVRVSTDWKEVPDKVEGHNAAEAMKRAERKVAALASSIKLSPEDCALFAAARHVDARAVEDEVITHAVHTAWAASGLGRGVPRHPETFGNPVAQGALNLFMRGGCSLLYATGSSQQETLLKMAQGAGVELAVKPALPTRQTSEEGGATSVSGQLVRGIAKKGPAQCAMPASAQGPVMALLAASGVTGTPPPPASKQLLDTGSLHATRHSFCGDSSRELAARAAAPLAVHLDRFGPAGAGSGAAGRGTSRPAATAVPQLGGIKRRQSPSKPPVHPRQASLRPSKVLPVSATGQ